MGKPKYAYEYPTQRFPYKISKRINLMSEPKKNSYTQTEDLWPPTTEAGVRLSALNGKATDRLNEVAYPYLRNLLLLKSTYKNQFSRKRMQKVDKLIEAANATIYTKLANAAIDLRKNDKTTKDMKKKKVWSESDWKKHMDYISQIAGPKKCPEPEPISRGEIVSIDAILPRLIELSQAPESKIYRRLSQEDWYRDPLKVPESALTYVITDRIKKLATVKPVAA